MSRGYNQRSSFYLPRLCRASIKDAVNLPGQKLRSSSFSNSGDPSSPRVSCIGQVKRNNRVIGFPPPPHNRFTNPSSSFTSKTTVKYTKLKRLFSGKNITAAAAATTPTCRIRRRITNDQYVTAPVDIKELDPPLPVVKRPVQQPGSGGGDGGAEVNLWKRRSRGPALKTLEIQHLHAPINDNAHLSPTTV